MSDRALEGPERTWESVVQESTGAVVGGDWQSPFYAHLDAFLSAARSVGEVVNCCFGYDSASNRQAKKWWNERTSAERAARNEFSKHFKPHYLTFQQLELVGARHVSEHRKGYPDVTIVINSMFGVVFRGDPTTPLPDSQRRNIENGESARLNPKSFPLRPMQDDFTIGNVRLFDACQDYIKGARNLVIKARQIADDVHRHSALTPPSY